jgi:hypothetical protein
MEWGSAGVVAFLARVAESPVAATVPVGVWFGVISQLARSCEFGSTQTAVAIVVILPRRFKPGTNALCLISPERSPADSIEPKPYRNAVANHLQSGGDCGLWSRYAKRSAGCLRPVEPDAYWDSRRYRRLGRPGQERRYSNTPLLRRFTSSSIAWFRGSLGSSSRALFIADSASVIRPRRWSAIAKLLQGAPEFGMNSVLLRAAISDSSHLPISARHQVSSSQASPFVGAISRTAKNRSAAVSHR